MNKKIFVILATVLAISLILTPLAIAKPGEVKENEKWQTFELLIVGGGETGKFWQTPPEPAEPKTTHSRGNIWYSGDELTGTVSSVIITIGGTETYSLIEEGGILDYYALLNANNNLNKMMTVGLKETIRFMDGATEIGTLEITVSDQIFDGDYTTMTGTFVGIGTGALKGVKLIGTDLLSLDPFAVMRSGIIMNWPGLP
jgi:hypothetical protein